jgi:hypothetical protein
MVTQFCFPQDIFSKDSSYRKQRLVCNFLQRFIANTSAGAWSELLRLWEPRHIEEHAAAAQTFAPLPLKLRVSARYFMMSPLLAGVNDGVRAGVVELCD